MQKWDSRPVKPDKTEWTLLVSAFVIIAVVIVYSLLT